MTQNTLQEYNTELEKLQKEQKSNIEKYNRQKTKISKRKIMNEKIIPLEIKIEEVRKK